MMIIGMIKHEKRKRNQILGRADRERLFNLVPAIRRSQDGRSQITDCFENEA